MLEQNVFLETLLPRAVLRALSNEEFGAYRRPFREAGEGRRHMLSWPRQVPIDDERADMAEIVTAYGAWLAGSDVPKLYITNEPGTAPQAVREFCRVWRAQTEVTVKGSHYARKRRCTKSSFRPRAWIRRWLHRRLLRHDQDGTLIPS